LGSLKYTENWDENKEYEWKVSVDGKAYGMDKTSMVMVGITPMGFDSVALQSCYAVFPLALTVGEEKTEKLKEQLSELWKEMKELREKGEVKLDSGKIHKFLILVFSVGVRFRDSESRGSPKFGHFCVSKYARTL